MQFAKMLALLLILAGLPPTPAAAGSPEARKGAAPSRPPAALVAEVEALARASNVDGLRAKGERVMPILAELYRRSDEGGRTALASIFYQLSFRSEAAKEAMMADVHTENRNLRLQVQWALGRVSNDDAVVDALLDNLENDVNPLFRDKAACGIASDQVHLTEPQKVRLYYRLIALLEAPRVETRRLAIQVLEVHTGQRKGFVPAAPESMRTGPLAAWKKWLAEYEASLS